MGTPLDILDALVEAVEKARTAQPIGTPENPYHFYFPGWLEDRMIANGSSCQETLDRDWMWPAVAHIVRDY